MKRLATLAFYAVGAAAVAYLALYAYVTLTGRELRPGAPIQIFRKPDAPSYSTAGQLFALEFPEGAGGSPLSPCGRGEVEDITPSPRTRGDRCCRPA